MSEDLTPIKTNAKPETSDVSKTTKHEEPSMKLIAYNLLSGCLWSFALLNVIATRFAFGNMYDTFRLTYIWTTIIQCLAVVEIYNSAIGLVRSPIVTTTMQVLSRLLVVLGVWTLLPYAKGNTSFAYITVHIAWGIAEVIRYYYYATNLMSKQTGNPIKVSPSLEWLRYNAFIILYPLGISSECYMIFYAVKASYATPGLFYAIYSVFLSLALLSYIPGTIVLFSHMLKQRAKFNKQRSELKSKKST